MFDSFKIEDNTKRIDALEEEIKQLKLIISKMKRGGVIYSDGFKKFWAMYPRKTAKPNAFRKWQQMDCEEIVGRIMDGLSKFQFNMDDGGQYIPHPATWLNQRRWEDEGVGQTQRRDPITGRVIRG